jgi:hypothetical protein
MRDRNILIPADILRMLPIRLQHSQLYAIADSDADFPTPIRLGKKKFYRRDRVERWIANKFGENAVTAPSEKPRKRPDSAKRRRHVKS